MITKLRNFFQQNLANESASDNCYKLATAALLFEVAYADQETTDDEKNKLKQLLKQQFNLTKEELDSLTDFAEAEVNDSNDIYQFTRLINDHYDYPQRCTLVYLLWQVAIADGNIDKYEEYTIRKICGLIFVDHGDFIRAKVKALNPEL